MNNRKPLNPAKGYVSWCGKTSDGCRILSITPEGGERQQYIINTVADGYDMINYSKVLTTGIITVYHVRYWADGMFSCDCPDATKRPERKCNCKHSRGLLAALKSDPF